MNQNQKQIIPSFDESQINEQGVVSLAIRPNQRSQYGVGNLTGKQLQERFDRLTTLTIKHLNDVIKMLNEKDILTTSDLISEISDLLTKIYNEEDGLIAKNPVSDEDTGLNEILEDLYDYIGALNTFTKISEYINEDNPDATLDDIFATITALENHESATDAHPDAIKKGVDDGIATHNASEDAHKGKFLTADDVVNSLNGLEPDETLTKKPLSAKQGNVLLAGINAEIQARKKAIQYCLHQQENDSGMRKAVCLTAAKDKPIAEQTGIFVQNSYNSKNPTQYESIPVRGASGSHIGTFEIAHPEMDTTKSSYSQYHPMTVGVAEDRYMLKSAAGGGGGEANIEIDEELNADSANPVQNKAIVAAINALKEELTYEPIKILQFSGSVSGNSICEVGSTWVDPTFTWQTNKKPSTLRVSGYSEESNIEGTSGQIKKLGTLRQTTTYTLFATDEKGAEAKASTAIYFYNGVYYGVSDSTNITNDLILGLDKSLRGSKLNSFTASPTEGQYIYYCLPQSYGTCKFKDADTGLGYAFEGPVTVSFTNKSKYTEDYYVYRSTNAIAGTANIIVS